MEFIPGSDFAKAVCDHFELPVDRVECNMSVDVGYNQVFGVRVKIMLSPDDVMGIAAIMGGRLPSGKIQHKTIDGTIEYVRSDNVVHRVTKTNNATAIDNFDAWMRERNAAAHQEFMARTSAARHEVADEL